MNEGERVRWYVLGLGSEEDFHTAHWHGLRVIEEGRRRTDNIELLPATMKVADMIADNPGSWLFHCHVADHMNEGMFARVIVHPKDGAGASRAPEHRYFGLRQAQQSLLIKRAEASIDQRPNAPAPCEIRIAGSVTVFDAFSVFTQSVRVRIGQTSVEFKPDRRGVATAPNGSWTVTNAGRFGVVYGGMMEFEVVVTGSAWLAELQKLGLTQANSNPAEQKVSTPVVLHVGNAQHTAKAELLCRAR